MEIVGCRAEGNACPFRPPAMLFHGISGGHIQGIMEEMERRSKTESRLAKAGQMNGREAVSETTIEPRAFWGGRAGQPRSGWLGRVRRGGGARINALQPSKISHSITEKCGAKCS